MIQYGCRILCQRDAYSDQDCSVSAFGRLARRTSSQQNGCIHKVNFGRMHALGPSVARIWLIAPRHESPHIHHQGVGLLWDCITWKCANLSTAFHRFKPKPLMPSSTFASLLLDELTATTALYREVHICFSVWPSCLRGANLSPP